MKKKVKLRDGSTLLIRSIKDDDIRQLVALFRSLPERDRVYLRRDVRKRRVVEQMIADVNARKARRLVAVDGDRIVAEGALELETHAWKKHVGELRLVVARPYQRKGLGMSMARELYHIAARRRLEELIVKMMRPQRGARKIFRRLGFQEVLVLPDYVTDLNGKKQDFILMRCDIEALWQELEDYFAQSDWQRVR
jgi:L-amino acid N-acyltransferase YncA